MFESEALGIDVRDESVLSDFDAETGDELFGFRGKIVGISSEDAGAAFEKNDARFFGTNAAEIVAEGFLGNFGDSAGEFESGGTAADDDEGEPSAGFLFGAGALRLFEGVE